MVLGTHIINNPYPLGTGLTVQAIEGPDDIHSEKGYWVTSWENLLQNTALLISNSVDYQLYLCSSIYYRICDLLASKFCSVAFYLFVLDLYTLHPQ